MANKVLIQEIDGLPAQITFADIGGDFLPSTNNNLRHASAVDTEGQLSLANLANTAARQSAKVDLGENRSVEYNVRAALEFATAPTSGELVEFYWAPAQNATAAIGNSGGASGSDSAYTGYSSNIGESVLQLQLIGGFICTPQATPIIQICEIGKFSPIERYGSLVIVNNSGASLHSDDIEMHVVLDPVIIEIQ